MKESFKKIILGKFLINEGSIKNWGYVFFLFSICLIMIYSSHSEVNNYSCPWGGEHSVENDIKVAYEFRQ